MTIIPGAQNIKTVKKDEMKKSCQELNLNTSKF